jgi:hypothetical protein
VVGVLGSSSLQVEGPGYCATHSVLLFNFCLKPGHHKESPVETKSSGLTTVPLALPRIVLKEGFICKLCRATAASSNSVPPCSPGFSCSHSFSLNLGSYFFLSSALYILRFRTTKNKFKSQVKSQPLSRHVYISRRKTPK